MTNPIFPLSNTSPEESEWLAKGIDQPQAEAPAEQPTELFPLTPGAVPPQKTYRPGLLSPITLAKGFMALPYIHQHRDEIVEGAWESAKRTVTLGRRAMTGELPLWAQDEASGEIHTSPEAITEGLEFALNTAVGAGVVPKPIPKGGPALRSGLPIKDVPAGIDESQILDKSDFVTDASGKPLKISPDELAAIHNLPGAQKKPHAAEATKQAEDMMDEFLAGDKNPKADLYANKGKGAVPFFSALSAAIEKSPLTSAPKEQWIGTLKNTPGVKQEEIDWALADLPEGKLDKKTVQEHFAANQIEVKEVVKGEPLSDKDWEVGLEKHAQHMYGRPFRELAPNEQDAVGDIVRQPASKETKFGNYQMPGGENYRELLLTLPTEASKLKWEVKKDGRGLAVTRSDGTVQGRWSNATETDVAQAQLHADNLNRGSTETLGEENAFRGGHYDEPNVLAHVRFNDRVDAQGRKTLFIEEIQSDWHQKGRKQGYRGEVRPEYSVKQNENGDWDILAPDGTLVDVTATERLARDAARQYDEGASVATDGGRVPDAPFKSSWPELALKRMIKWASDHGYDQIAWTPGKVQAARYDLSKQISKLQYDDGNHLVAYDHKNARVIDAFYKPEELPDVVGKDVADKLINAEKKNIRDKHGGNVTTRELSGVDLQVGGEGMEAFYDKMLVNAANKLGKKYGAKVGVTKLDRFYGNYDEAAGPIDKRVMPETEVWSLPITDAMRTTAQSEGFALFANAPKSAPVFAALGTAIDQSPLRSGSHAHWAGELKKAGADLNEIGFIEWGKGKDKITRDDVSAFVKDAEAKARVKSDTRQTRAAVVERLDTLIPQEARVRGGEYKPGQPGTGTAWSHLPDEMLNKRGSGFKGTDDDIRRMWDEAVEESSEAAKIAVGETGADALHFSAKDWDKAFRLPLRVQLWYELGGEAFVNRIKVASKWMMQFYDLIGATSARARPGENLERGLAILSQRMRGDPVDIDITTGAAVEEALKRGEDATGSNLAIKTGNFSDTHALVSGVENVKYPITVNDVWVARMFGITDKQLMKRQSLHEPFSIFFNKMRDFQNKNVAPGEIPHESWQIQARGWVEKRETDGGADTASLDLENTDYAHEMDKIVQKLEDRGIEVPDGIITEEILMDERFAPALRATTEAFRNAPKATVEFGTLLTVAGKKADEVISAAMEAGYTKPQEEYLGVLTSAMSKSSRGKMNPWDTAVAAATGVKGDVTRIAVPTKDDPFAVSGTFEGKVSPNIRVPLKVKDKDGIRNLTPDEIAYLNAVAGKGLKQAAMAAVHIIRLGHGQKLPLGAVESAAIRFDWGDAVPQSLLTDITKELGPGFEVSAVRNPDGVYLDVNPKFGEKGPEGPTDADLSRVNTMLESKYGVEPEFFRTAYTSEYGKNYVEASAYDEIIANAQKRWKADAVSKLTKLGFRTGKDAKAYLETGKTEVELGDPRAAKRVREELRQRTRDHAKAEEAFGQIASDIDAKLAEKIPEWEKKAAKAKTKKKGPVEPGPVGADEDIPF